MNTCTVYVSGGKRCGRPAVHTFVGRDENTYHECDEHYMPTSSTRNDVTAGDAVNVRHAGLDKRGIVERTTPTFVWVWVSNANGDSKVVRYRREDVRPA